MWANSAPCHKATRTIALLSRKCGGSSARSNPTLARSATFLDWQTYRLGRLQSEMRTEYKKSRLTPAT